MGEILSLSKARKSRERDAAKAAAQENRNKFGRSKAEKQAATKVSDLEARRIEAHRRASETDPNSDDGSLRD